MGEFGDGAGTISFFQAEKLAKGVYAYDMKALAGEKYAKEKGMFHLYFWSGEAQNSPDVKVRISGMYLSRDGKLDKGEPAEGRKLALTEENTAAMKDTEIELQADGGMLLRVQKPLRFAENVTAVATVTLREFDLSKTPYLFIDYQAPSMRVGAGGAETLGVYFQTYAADGTNLGDVMPPSGGGRYSPNGSALRFESCRESKISWTAIPAGILWWFSTSPTGDRRGRTAPSGVCTWGTAAMQARTARPPSSPLSRPPRRRSQPTPRTPDRSPRRRLPRPPPQLRRTAMRRAAGCRCGQSL